MPAEATDPDRDQFEAWWAVVHDQVWTAIEDGHEHGEITMLMMLTRRESDHPRPHMFVGKNFDDVGTEITMLEDAVERIGVRAFDPTVQRRIHDVRRESRQVRRRVARQRRPR